MAIPIPKSLAGYKGFEGKSRVFFHSVCHTNSLWCSRNSVNTCSLKFVPCFLGFLICKPKRAGHDFFLALIILWFPDNTTVVVQGDKKKVFEFQECSSLALYMNWEVH